MPLLPLRLSVVTLVLTMQGFIPVLAQGTRSPGAPAAPPNLMAEAARSVGFIQCITAVERLSALAINGSRGNELLLDWDRVKPDSGPLFGMMGIEFANTSVAASIAVVPQQNGDCTISAERISVAPFTCRSVAEVELKGYTATALLPTFNVFTIASDPGASVSLIDTPPSCLIIRRHVQYGYKDPTASKATAR